MSNSHENSPQIGSYLEAIEDEEDRLWREEDEQISQADRLQAHAAAENRRIDEISNIVKRTLQHSAPPGYTNDPKVRVIVDKIMHQKGITDPQTVQRVVRNFSQQARQSIRMRNISELDRVYLAIRQGVLR